MIKTVFLIEKNNAKQLSKSIKFLVDNPDFGSKMSLENRQKSEEFTWSFISDKWKSILTS